MPALTGQGLSVLTSTNSGAGLSVPTGVSLGGAVVPPPLITYVLGVGFSAGPPAEYGLNDIIPIGSLTPPQVDGETANRLNAADFGGVGFRAVTAAFGFGVQIFGALSISINFTNGSIGGTAPGPVTYTWDGFGQYENLFTPQSEAIYGFLMANSGGTCDVTIQAV